MNLDGFGPRLPVRDEFGLPQLSQAVGKARCDPFVDKLKAKADAREVFEEMPTQGEALNCDVTKVANDARKESVGLPHSKKPSVDAEISGNVQGHSTAACPKIIRIWKPKESSPVEVPLPKESENTSNNATVADKHDVLEGSVKATPSKVNEWTDVKRKKAGSPSDFEASPSPPVTFRNLRVVDEIDVKRGTSEQSDPKVTPKKLTKSQKKRLKASRGIDTPPLS
ncbi:hypothetical protein ACET3Z_031565 [Daucus carota]